MNPTRLAAPLFVLALAGCGAATDTPSAATTTATPTPSNTATPVPSLTFPVGIYVAAHNGVDSDDGSALRPMKTIHAALERAIATGKTDVWLIGGGPDTEYHEVVLLRDGVNLHGDVCTPLVPPLQQDRIACSTVIDGGSPSVVGLEMSHPTLVENLTVRSMPIQTSGEAFYEIPGHGCAIRTDVVSAEFGPCNRPVDAHGRPVPDSSVAMLLRNSKLVTLSAVDLEASKAADGLDGIDGSNGANGIPGLRGGDAGADFSAAGAGGAAVVNPACPEAAGGAGGRGGAFALSTFLGHTVETVVQAEGVGAPRHDWRRNAGLSGTDRAEGANGLQGMNGTPANPNALDVESLIVPDGADGADGTSGQGGVGGSGGAPGSRKLVRTLPGGLYSQYALAGDDAAFTTSPWSVIYGQGETAGGGGGSGASGGCAGAGGTAGQGGGSSVGLLLLESQATILSGTVQAGDGGTGGAGGRGGYGGNYALGGFFGSGASVNTPLNGQWLNGEWIIGANQTLLNGTSNYYYSAGPSIGGRGGIGGASGNGGSGGDGAAGVSGVSFSVVGTVNSTCDAAGAQLLWGSSGSRKGAILILP